MRRFPHGHERRRGVQTLELILVTPVIVLVLLATLEFGMLNITHAAVAHAATVGAREAGKLAPNGDIRLLEVVDEVNEVLMAHDISITNIPGSGTKLTIQDGADPLNPLVFGDPGVGCGPPANPVLDADEVRLTLCIDFGATKLNGAPVIDAFSYCGFTFAGKRFKASAVAKKET